MKSLLFPLPIGVGFRQPNFKSRPKPASTKKNSDCVGTNTAWIMEHGILDPKLVSFNCKQQKTDVWQASTEKELLKTNI